MLDIESNAGNQRILVQDHDPSVQSWNLTIYCNPTSPPVKEEYHVIVKEGILVFNRLISLLIVISNYSYFESL